MTKTNELKSSCETGIAERPFLKGSVIPRSELGSALMGIVTTIPMGVVATALAVYGFELYGLVLFCLLPFSIGVSSTLLYGFHEPRSLWRSLLVSQLAIFMVGAAIFLLAMEGLICLIMAAPIAMGLAGIGGGVGWVVAKRYFGTRIRTATLVALLVGVPALMGFEDATYAEPDWITVTTEVFVDAPQEKVWEHLVDAAALESSEDTLFRRGVAHPTYLEVEGNGPGARLRGEFNTGAFEVVFDEWDAPHRLGLSVAEHPPTMQEWSIYGEIDAPHLVDYFACEEGEIELHATEAGGTKLVGTTLCRQQIGPAWYWTQWSENVIDRLHRHVLDDVRRRAEAAQSGVPSVAASET